MKFTKNSIRNIVLILCISITTASATAFSASSTYEVKKSSSEINHIGVASSPEVTREWVVGTYYASPEVIRTVTIQSDPIIIEKIVKVEKFHASAPKPVILQKTGPENLLFLLLGIFLLGGGILANRKKEEN